MGRREAWALAALLLVASSCDRAPARQELVIPHGYLARLEVKEGGIVHGFGPFVGYYFRPEAGHDLGRLRFVCFNERGFYASDAPVNARLFEGEAVLARLPPTGAIPQDPEARIQPVFFAEAPEAWLATRPEPREEFVHFHSCYDALGPSRVGYWLRHRAAAEFTYDMGGRVGPTSPLFHRVTPGPDRGFARIVEFDRGPARDSAR